MLYITTRGDRDAFTAHRTLCTDCAPDGGCYIPMRFPQFSPGEINKFANQSFEETVADILNIFFSAGLTHWDVSLCIGKNSARVSEMSPKICLAELWHNAGNGFQHFLDGLFLRICGGETDRKPTEWFIIAVRFAVLFGVYGQLCSNSMLNVTEQIDISVPADDFSYPMATVYACCAGLPIGSIICNSTETHEVWNLLHRGTIHTSPATPQLQQGIERLLHCRIGSNAADSFVENNFSFEVEAEELSLLQSKMSCFVSGKDRVMQTLNSVYRNSKRIISPDSALCIAGLGDYRAKNRESRLTLIIECDSPALYGTEIEKATGVPIGKLEEFLRD